MPPTPRPTPPRFITELFEHPRRTTYLLAVAFALGTLVPFGSAFPTGVEKEITNALHFPAFFLLTLVLFALWSRRFPTWGRALLTIGGILIATVLGTEIIQPLFGRNASIGDILAGLYGVTLALLSLIIFHYHHRHTATIFTTTLLAIGTTTFARPLYLEIQAARVQNRAFPLLVDSNERLMLRLWRPVFSGKDDKVTREIVSTPGQPAALKVTIEKGSYAGVRLSANDQDWSEYNYLEIDLSYEGAPTQIAVRVDDYGDCREYDDRFNATFELPAGETKIRVHIPAMWEKVMRRKFQTWHIRYLYVFLPGDVTDSGFTIRKVALR